MTTRKLVFAAIVAAAYAALTLALGFISYGPLQLRVAEALCVLPFFFPFTVWGLSVGCVLANIISPLPLDIIVGAAATLLAALCTALIGKMGRERAGAKIFACLPPVIFNAVFVGALIAYHSGEAFMPAFIGNGLLVGSCEFVVMYALGLPLLIFLPKTKLFGELSK